jgi:dTDP-4-amino-4,6-dideoxygalactose transaminase
MDYIEKWTEGRRSVAGQYDRLLADSRCRPPAPPPHSRHVYHVYAIRVTDRDQVQEALQGAGIATSIHYPVPVHLQKAYADLGYGPGDLPVSEEVGNQFLSLPIYAELEPNQVSAVVAELNRACVTDPVKPPGPSRARSTA